MLDLSSRLSGAPVSRRSLREAYDLIRTHVTSRGEDRVNRLTTLSLLSPSMLPVRLSVTLLRVDGIGYKRGGPMNR